MNAAAAKAFHLVAYARREGEELAEEDVLAHGKLAVPADQKAGVEGDAVKATLSKTENHQCNGEEIRDALTLHDPEIVKQLARIDEYAARFRALSDQAAIAKTVAEVKAATLEIQKSVHADAAKLLSAPQLNAASVGAAQARNNQAIV